MLHGVGAVERAHQRGRLRRIADFLFDLFVRVDEFADDVVVNRFMHEQAARRRAALAGGADGAEHDRGNREFQIGRFDRG